MYRSAGQESLSNESQHPKRWKRDEAMVKNSRKQVPRVPVTLIVIGWVSFLVTHLFDLDGLSGLALLAVARVLPQ